MDSHPSPSSPSSSSTTDAYATAETSYTSHDPRVAAIVRRHAHDVRNYINSLDLEASLLEELITDPEIVSSVRRMRGQLNQLEATVRGLSVKFAEPRPIALTASDLLHLWKSQFSSMDEINQTTQWVSPAESHVIMVDPSIVVSVLRELVLGSRKRSISRDLVATVKASPEAVIAELNESSQAVFVPDELEEQRRLVTANGGTLIQDRDPVTNNWITRLSFPAVEE